MNQWTMIAKLFVLCMLKNAVLGQGGKTESNFLPKNVIVLLAGDFPSDGVIPEKRGLVVNGSSDDVPSRSPLVLLSEKMPISGFISPGDTKKSASGVDLDTLKIIFNGLDSGNDSSVRFHSNLLHVAQQAGKATGLVTTVDITSEIPAAISVPHIESSDSNCSESDNQLLNLNIILGQRPVTPAQEEKIRNCLFNYTYYSDPKSLLLKPQGEPEATSKEMKNNVLGLFPRVGPEDLKTMTSAALQFLRKNENGFFLVTITGRPQVAGSGTREMATQFLEEFQVSGLSLETLVIATSVEEKVPCCKPSRMKGSRRRGKTNIPPPSILKGKLSKNVVKFAGLFDTLRKDFLEEKVHTEASISKTPNQKTIKSEDNNNIIPSEIILDVTGFSETSETFFNEKTSPSGSENLFTPEMSTEKYEYYEYSTVDVSAQPSANITTENYLTTGSTVLNELGREVLDEMATSATMISPPLSEAAAIITSSLPYDSSVFNTQKTTYSSNTSSSEVDVLPSTESFLIMEKKLPENETEENFGKTMKRKKREADPVIRQGIPIYASGPGSSSLNKTLTPLALRRVLEVYISTPCEEAQFSSFWDVSEVNCSGKVELSPMRALSSSTLIRSKSSFLVLGIGVTYTLVTMN